MDIKPTLTFEIKNSRDFYNKLLEEYSDFCKDHFSSRFAMNCAITSWHLTDWTYLEFYKNNARFQDSKKIDKKGCVKFISGLQRYQQFITKQCPELEYMKLITNGIKHCVLSDKDRKEKTIVHEGDFSADFSRHDFDVTRFVIEINENSKIDFEETLLKTINYWKVLLEKNGQILQAFEGF